MDEYIAFVNQRLALLPERVRPQPVVNLQSSFKDGYAMLGTPHRERERKEREEERSEKRERENLLLHENWANIFLRTSFDLSDRFDRIV
jgi:hypothetical protein